MALHPNYATTAELRAYVSSTSTADDTNLGLAITAASRAVDHYTDRQFGVLTVAAARYYTPLWSVEHNRYLAHIDDLQTITSLVLKSDLDNNGVYETTVTDYRLWPLNAAGDGLPWTEAVFGTSASVSCLPGALEVTALWGWTAVPDTVKEAALLQASRFAERKVAPFGIAGSPEMGNSLRLLSKVDADVEVMLRPYRRWAMV